VEPLPSSLPDAPDFLPEALDATWYRHTLPASETLGDLERLIRVPAGFAALYRRSLGSGKVVGGWESRLLVSADGMDWDARELLFSDEQRFFRDIAFGGGCYVAVGHHFQQGLIWRSINGVDWDAVEVASDALHAVRYVGGRFFALATFEDVLVSEDGVSWHKTTTETLQPSDVGHGSGVFVLVGSGPFQRATDGLNWSPYSVDCGLPEACVTDPGGGVHQPPSAAVFYGAGAFYTDSGWRSGDGKVWQQVMEAERPDGVLGGYLVKHAGDDSLRLWRDTFGDVQAPVSVLPAESSHGCEGADCRVFGDEILWIPSPPESL